MRKAGARAEGALRPVAKDSEAQGRKRRNERTQCIRNASCATKDSSWAEWEASAGAADLCFTKEIKTSLLTELPRSPAGTRVFPPQPRCVPPPPPVEKARVFPPQPSCLPPPPPVEISFCGSACSFSSDESTDCVSEPSERLDAAGSEVGELVDSEFAGSKIGVFEIDFDSLVFELSPDDVWDSPSSIRMIPTTYVDEDEEELRRLLGSPVEPACKVLPGTCGSTRLSSRARAWTPGASVPSLPTRIACSQIQGILAAVQVAMVSSGLAIEGEILERAPGWAITMYVHATNLVLKEQVITLGKAALIENSKRSQSIYVVGYCSQPFVVTPLGFSAILCEVENSSDACWNFVQNGFCRYGNGCKRRHPSHQAIVNVMIKIKESD